MGNLSFNIVYKSAKTYPAPAHTFAMSVFDYFDQIQIINLPHRTDRRREMEDELHRIGLKNDPRVHFFLPFVPTILLVSAPLGREAYTRARRPYCARLLQLINRCSYWKMIVNSSPMPSLTRCPRTGTFFMVAMLLLAQMISLTAILSAHI